MSGLFVLVQCLRVGLTNGGAVADFAFEDLADVTVAVIALTAAMRRTVEYQRRNHVG